MMETLRHRLLSIDKLKPYVWRMRLTEDEYRHLRDYVLVYGQVID